MTVQINKNFESSDPFERSLYLISNPEMVFLALREEFPVFVVMRVMAYVKEHKKCYTQLKRSDFKDMNLTQEQEEKLLSFYRDKLYFSVE